MRCPKCRSTAVKERPERTAQGYRRFRCPDGALSVALWAWCSHPAYLRAVATGRHRHSLAVEDVADISPGDRARAHQQLQGLRPQRAARQPPTSQAMIQDAVVASPLARSREKTSSSPKRTPPPLDLEFPRRRGMGPPQRGPHRRAGVCSATRLQDVHPIVQRQRGVVERCAKCRPWAQSNSRAE